MLKLHNIFIYYMSTISLLL